MKFYVCTAAIALLLANTEAHKLNDDSKLKTVLKALADHEDKPKASCKHEVAPAPEVIVQPVPMPAPAPSCGCSGGNCGCGGGSKSNSGSSGSGAKAAKNAAKKT
jgi:hypothetical protein